jgi:hypothetical protein
MKSSMYTHKFCQIKEYNFTILKRKVNSVKIWVTLELRPVSESGLKTLGSMLWSHFSAICANFRQKMAFFSKTNAMTNFLQKLAVL